MSVLYNNPMNLRRFFSLLLLLSAMAVQAQGAILRAIPEGASFGELKGVGNGQIAIGAYLYRLAPGAQVRGTDNLIRMPDALASISGGVPVRYQVDMNGDVIRVWILSAAEYGNLNPRKMPAQPLPLPSSPPMGETGAAASSVSN
ncbi:MAG TPA: hypothetical protein VFK74_06805 [Azospira sp.]|nr:hypothetical protein [Azospira sp.]